ncbi:MAG TPA: hypothetical protein VFX28_21430, partial [Methylomirabilota bacterium]|nr:hypothetical protein [Methylomirabilota bacterium]
MADSPPSADESRLWRGQAEERFQWGGYLTLEPMRPADRRAWLRDFRRTYLERDLADLGRVADLDQFAMAPEPAGCADGPASQLLRCLPRASPSSPHIQPKSYAARPS